MNESVLTTTEAPPMCAKIVENRIKIRAAVNVWIGEQFPNHRKFLLHTNPEYCPADHAWGVELMVRVGGETKQLGRLLVDEEELTVRGQDPARVVAQVATILDTKQVATIPPDSLVGDGYAFHCSDGINGVNNLGNRSIDLLLTDPPYGISNPYTCENQVPRRLRKDGRDFIMPRGDFGAWDDTLTPQAWLSGTLPKVRGWVVTFCAQAQIGDYCAILKESRFVAVGTIVWQKTNPVPFNHRFKPINAWEAIVVGKRSGTPFYGHVVHNVLCYKAPSPQERIHPTQKPLPLIERLLELFSAPGDVVVDPFAGSGTMVIAGSRMGREVNAYENNPTTFKAACERIAAALS